MKKHASVILSVLCSVVMICGVASASTLNVDFGTPLSPVYVGTRAAPDLGTFWNGLYLPNNSTNNNSTFNPTVLKYSDGTSPSAINVTTTATRSYTDGGPPNALLTDRIFVAPGGANSFTVEINNVSAGLYDLYVYGSYPLWDSEYTVNGISDYTDLSPGPDYKEYAKFNVNLISDGPIVINVDTYGTSTAAVIGGFQLHAVPVPATLLLLGAGLAGLAGLRRKND